MMVPRLTLRDVMPHEFIGGEYDHCVARRFSEVEVIKECDATNRAERWPGTHKNVYFWVKLANGKSVGWNENPVRGWSFSVINTPQVELGSERQFRV